MDAMTYEAAPVENIGWMSEAHRLLLGANRSRKGPTTARNTNRSSEIALATRPQSSSQQELRSCDRLSAGSRH